MPTSTTTYALSKPTVGGDTDTWGTELNNNADKLDDLLDGTLAIAPNLTAGAWKVGGVAVTPTAAELNFVDGVTSAIQTQLDGKFTQRTITGTANQITVTNGDGASGNPTIAASVASQLEAEAGVDTSKLMTPQRTAQAIAALGIATDYQVFTASGTWTKPAGCKWVYVECISGGASGSAARFVAAGDRGGNGGISVSRLLRAADLDATETVTVGAGGAAVTRSTDGFTNGNDGGGSSLGVHVSSSVTIGPLSTGNLGTYSYFQGPGVSVFPSNSTVFGGGGGGGARSVVAEREGGNSQYGGKGGTGNFISSGSATATAGAAPGGGGGSAGIGQQTGTATSGAGARGEVRVWAW